MQIKSGDTIAALRLSSGSSSSSQPTTGGKGVLRNQVAPAGKVTNDGVGLCEPAAVLKIDDRHLPRTVEFKELRGSALLLENIDRNPRIGQAQTVADPFYLQANQ